MTVSIFFFWFHHHEVRLMAEALKEPKLVSSCSVRAKRTLARCWSLMFQSSFTSESLTVSGLGPMESPTSMLYLVLAMFFSESSEDCEIGTVVSWLPTGPNSGCARVLFSSS